MAMEVKSNVFELPISVTANGEVVKTLKTQDTYIDKNIKVVVSTPDATFERKTKAAGANGEISASVSTTDTTYTSSTETAYPITIAADAHVNSVTVGTKDAGFTASTDEITVDGADAEQDSKTIYIKAGHLAGSGSASAESSSVGLTKVASQPSSGFYIKASAAGGASVDTAGWLPVGASADASGDAYYTVKTASLSNAEANADSYTELSAPVLTEDGYLFIKEGYIADSKISLATLVPDGSTLGTVTEASSYMYNTIKAYDNDGKLVTGTMGNATLSAITANDAAATINTLEVTNADDASVLLYGNTAITGSTSVSIASRGLAETSLSQTGTISGTATTSAQVDKVGVGTVVADDKDSLYVTPVISKESSSTAKSGSITKTIPTGSYYVAVSTAKSDDSTSVSAKVTSSGYGLIDEHAAAYATTGYNAAEAVTITGGANASGTYYVPITAGSHTVTKSASEITAPVTTVTTAVDGGDVTAVTYAESGKVAGAKYVKIAGSATTSNGSVQTKATCTSTEGYITADSNDIVTTETVSVADASAVAKYIRVYEGEVID